MWGAKASIRCWKKQRGAAMVEMAITSALFFFLVFAIFEMALLVFTWAKATEASRQAARWAIVSSPVVDISAIDCSTTSEVSTLCTSSDCGPMMNLINSFLPDVNGDNVEVSYRCSTTGFPDRPAAIAIREVTVGFVNVSYDFVTPELLGLEPSISMPSFTTTRTGEDLFSN